MKKLILAASLLSSTMAFASEPITIFQMNMSMSIEDRANVAKAKGFKCFNYEKQNYVVCTKIEESFEEMKAGLNLYAATVGIEDRVVLSEEKIEIGCAAYSNCKAGLKEIAQYMVTNGYIGELEYRTNVVYGTNMMAQWYEGIGRANDKLIVNPRSLVIEKHRLDSSFNLD